MSREIVSSFVFWTKSSILFEFFLEKCQTYQNSFALHHFFKKYSSHSYFCSKYMTYPCWASTVRKKFCPSLIKLIFHTIYLFRFSTKAFHHFVIEKQKELDNILKESDTIQTCHRIGPFFEPNIRQFSLFTVSFGVISYSELMYPDARSFWSLILGGEWFRSRRHVFVCHHSSLLSLLLSLHHCIRRSFEL